MIRIRAGKGIMNHVILIRMLLMVTVHHIIKWEMNCAVLFWRKKGIFFATQKIFICHASHFSTKLQVSNCSIFSRKFTCYEIRNCLFFAWQTLPSIKFREENAKLFSAELDTRTWKYFWTNIDERGQISKSVSKMVFVEEFVLF